MIQRITSRKNPRVTELRRLASQRDFRRERGLFLGDGIKLLEEAVRWNAPLDTVVVTRGLSLPRIPEDVDVIEVPEDVMDAVSPMRSPQGALFLCRIPGQPIPDRLPGDRYLVLDGLQDPGNVGTIWRTADALGADGLILVNSCADPWNPKTVRATMGACFRLPVYEMEAEEMGALLERSGLPLYAAALQEDTMDIRTADLSRSAVVIGNEGRGVCPQVLGMSLGTLKIPMRDRCESLNAAAAAALVLWEMGRRTAPQEGRPPEAFPRPAGDR